jgi:hypothetical protein
MQGYFLDGALIQFKNVGRTHLHTVPTLVAQVGVEYDTSLGGASIIYCQFVSFKSASGTYVHTFGLSSTNVTVDDICRGYGYGSSRTSAFTGSASNTVVLIYYYHGFSPSI